MNCARCGMQIKVGVNVGLRLGRPMVVCPLCAEAVGRARMVAWMVSGFALAGMCALALFLNACVGPARQVSAWGATNYPLDHVPSLTNNPGLIGK